MTDLERADKHIVRNYDIRKRIGKGVRLNLIAKKCINLGEVGCFPVPLRLSLVKSLWDAVLVFLSSAATYD